MDSALAREVRLRAENRCEYCQLPQRADDRTYEIDHVISKKHGGLTRSKNLALSCFRCNSYKGSNIGGLDPLTHELTRLFNPRRHKWTRHFRWSDALLVGRTPIGRVTVAVLRINDPFGIELRAGLIAEGVFPPA